MSLREVYGDTAADSESRCDTCAHEEVRQCTGYTLAMTSDTQDLQQSVMRLMEQQDQLLKKLAALENPEGKDLWDKLGALSGLLIAIVGGLFSYLYSYQQSRQSEIAEQHQATLATVQTVSTFMTYLVGDDDAARSIALSEVENLLDARTVVLLAKHTNRAKAASGNPNRAVVNFLLHMADHGKTQAHRDLAKAALIEIGAGEVEAKR